MLRILDRFLNPYVAAKLGYIDDIIFPHETRIALVKSLHANIGKRVVKPARKHGNIPL